jgi:hypothetical protein
MKRIWKIIGLFVGVFLLAVSIHVLRAAWQTKASSDASEASKKQKALAVGIVRTVNTAEYSCRYKDRKLDESERFLSWDELLNAPCFGDAQDHFSQITGSPFSPETEITPGLELRLVVSADGRRYNLSLNQKNDSASCGFAFFSDERGVIYEGRAIGCEAPGVR